MNDLSWEARPENVSLGYQHVHVWRMRLDPKNYQVGEVQSKLSAEERSRAANFRSRDDRTSFIAAHHYTREILSKYLQLPAKK